MTDTCLHCGKPAFPHPYRHPLVLAEKKTPFELEQALEVDPDKQLEQMANVAAEWKSYYWERLQIDEDRERQICELIEQCAKAMLDGTEIYWMCSPYSAAVALAPVARILDIPTPYDILNNLCAEADE
ncbi:hypothetical protein [Nocardia jiangxiensis]|uniref:hypothetical protein n=1 Tax=Nocardia jiangxiensis TaxID=282685 RepID=UPI0003138E07|nr:hypothetical protein [Nocardia jiangxiensis]